MMDKERKPCPVCNKNDNPKSTNKGHLCKPCASNRTKEWFKNNPEQHFFNQIKAKYGINKQDYLMMVEKQNNKCAICGEEEEQVNVWKRDQKRRLAIDHNHITGEIRGLLCYRCNTTLGKLNEDVELLKNMIIYLEEF